MSELAGEWRPTSGSMSVQSHREGNPMIKKFIQRRRVAQQVAAVYGWRPGPRG